MNVIIAGAGEVGIYIAEKITAEAHDVTIIEADTGKVEEISNTLDVNIIPGNASSVQILKKAMVQNCDLFLSLTNNEEVNIVSASIANRLGAKKTIARFDTLISGIREFIAKHKTHLIVMGTQGATGAKEVLFGSNTVHVFKEIKCPVLAIPSNFIYENPHEILFPTDLEVNYKETQLNMLSEIAKSHNARINAMHVSTGNDLTETQISKKQELESCFEENSFLFHELKSMNVDEAINKFQMRTKTNMLAMINNKHSFFENIFFQSKLKQIGFHLNIPFLVIPSTQKQ